jgi:flagellar motor switch protein FliG
VQKISREVAHIHGHLGGAGERSSKSFTAFRRPATTSARGGIDMRANCCCALSIPIRRSGLLDRLTQGTGLRRGSFRRHSKADPQQLAKFIHNEHPQTIALVLSHLNYSQAPRC